MYQVNNKGVMCVRGGVTTETLWSSPTNVAFKQEVSHHSLNYLQEVIFSRKNKLQQAIYKLFSCCLCCIVTRSLILISTEIAILITWKVDASQQQVAEYRILRAPDVWRQMRDLWRNREEIKGLENLNALSNEPATRMSIFHTPKCTKITHII